MNNRDSYSFPERLQRNPVRRIWRIIYPVLIFIAIQVGIAVIFSIVAGIVVGVQEAMSNGIQNYYSNSTYDVAEITGKLTEFISKYTMHVVLITDIAGLAVFVPIWLKTKKYRPEIVRNTVIARPVILTALLVPGIALILSAVIGLLGMNDISESYKDVMEMITQSSFALQLITVAIIGPIVEELIFRGVVLNRALSWMPRWAAILISSALFGIVHMNLPQGVFAFGIGILCGWSYVRFRSIWVPIAAHVAVNLSSTIISKMSQGADLNNPEAMVPATIFLFGVIILSVLMIYPWLKTKNASIVYTQAELPPNNGGSHVFTESAPQEFVWRVAEDD